MSVAPMFKRILILGGILTAVIAVAGGGIGYLVASEPGLYSALAGAVLAAVFMGLTVASILVGAKLNRGPTPGAGFFGIVVGTWLAKLLIFVFVALWLQGQPWLDPMVFFFACLTAVLGFLIIDVVAFQTTRAPYVEVSLPGDDADRVEKSSADS